MRVARGSLLPLIAGCAVALVLASSCGDSSTRGEPVDAATLWTRGLAGHLYAPSSPWNTPIPAKPRLDPRSDAYVRTLVRAGRERGFVLAVEEWTVALAPASRTTEDVTLDAEWAPRRVLPDVPIPDGAAPDPQEDGHLAILDIPRGCEWDLWQASRTPTGRWRASWGNVTSLRGEGVYRDGLSARGSGFALAAGLVYPEALAAGRIDSALVVGMPYTAPRFVWPATKTDGRTSLPGAIPMGSRLQLDPGLDLDALDLAPHERVIARALQTYGMIVGDSGGAPSLYAVNPSSYPRDPYGGLLPPGAQVSLSSIPLARMRVLAPIVPPAQPRASACVP